MAQLPPHGCVKVVLHVPGRQRFHFYLLPRFAIVCGRRAVRCVPRPATHPSCRRLGARPSRVPVGREPARRRAAPRPRGAALRGKERVKSAARWQASSLETQPRRHDPTRGAAPSSDAKYGTDSRGESAKARARGQGLDTGARREPARPLSSGRSGGGRRRGTRTGRGGGRFPPAQFAIARCSRRSAKIQKVWLSCVAR